jgi:YHS domain-containing protein
MTVDREAQLTRELDGRTYSFCLEHCRHRFDADPQRYSAVRRRRLRGGRAPAH